MARKLTKEKLIAALVRIRKEAELTQQQLAKKLDKPQSYVSKYETGERTLDLIEAIEVFEAIGVNPIEQIKEIYSS